jgi:hypothetical protein
MGKGGIVVCVVCCVEDKTMDMNPREINLEIYLRTKCGGRNWLVVKVGYEGWPDDLIVTENGVHGWIELKRKKGGKVSELQYVRVVELTARFANVTIARSKEEIDAYLAELEVQDLAKKFRRTGVS